DEAVDAAPGAEHAAVLEVLGEELGRVADLVRLGSREVAFLGGGRLKQAVPVRAGRGCGHPQTLTHGLVLCEPIAPRAEPWPSAYWFSCPSRRCSRAACCRRARPARWRRRERCGCGASRRTTAWACSSSSTRGSRS